MIINPDFGQNYYSETSTSIYKIAHDNSQMMKWICYYKRSCFKNINSYDLMGSFLSCLNEIP